jgi:hypothetical protein
VTTRRIRMTGSDPDYYHFSTPSWSRPKSEVEHDLSICKRTGRITCSCEDASFRRERRYADLLDPEAETGCKHIRKLVETCTRHITTDQKLAA